MVTASAQTLQMFKCSLARGVWEGVVHASLHNCVPQQFKCIIKVPRESHFLSSCWFLTTFASRRWSSAKASVLDHTGKCSSNLGTPGQTFQPCYESQKGIRYLTVILKYLTHSSSSSIFLSFPRQSPASRCAKGAQQTRVQKAGLVKAVLLKCCQQTTVTSIQMPIQWTRKQDLKTHLSILISNTMYRQ